MTWTIEGKIEHLPGGYGGDGAHVGIDDLSNLLAEHVDKWAKVRVELIEGPRPLPYRSRSGKLVDYEPSPRPTEGVVVEQPKRAVVEDLKRMRTLATRVRKHIAMVRVGRGPAASVEEQCIDALAETMLVVCDQIEAFDRRLQSLETGSAT
jgi:hypothetical protein